MSNVSGWPARETRQSAIARAIDRFAPRPPDTLQALRRLVGADQFPQVFSDLVPSHRAGPPPASSGLSSAVQDRVAASTVKVSGVACKRIQEGSGWAVGNDLIVTNAHVVAGQRRTDVLKPDGRSLPATVIVFDAERDLAVLRVPGLGQTALTLGKGHTGETAAVFGHPGGQDPLRIAPAAVSEEVTAVGRDLYDAHDTRRDVFILASDIHPGDSGAAVVASDGTVIGVAFAIAPDRPGTAYALTAAEVRPVLAEATGSTAVDTGPCLTSA
jgi:S1-C subfamily serine protease